MDLSVHMIAVYFSLEFSAEEKSTRHLAMEGVYFLGGREEPVFQQSRHELVDLQRRFLTTEVKDGVFGEGFPQY